ncbi:MAG: OmpA family protein [Syntrophobacterales bacterium]|nr:OmpA family protein [Syntrophobacterales bacterium]
MSWQPVFAQQGEEASYDWYLQQGIMYERQSVFGEAIKMFTEAIAYNPDSMESYLRRGKAYRIHDLTETQKPMDDFSTVIDRDPRNAEAHYQRGLLNDYILKNQAAKADMLAASGLGHDGARRWLAALGTGRGIPQTAVVQDIPPVQDKHFTLADPDVAGLADYLPGGMQPVVFFDFNRSEVRSEGYHVLDTIAALLNKELSTTSVVIMGHTDSVGSERYNAGLSLRRAEAVKAYLSGQGVSSGRLLIKGYGKIAPADTNDTAEGRANNRRAVVGLLR